MWNFGHGQPGQQIDASTHPTELPPTGQQEDGFEIWYGGAVIVGVRQAMTTMSGISPADIRPKRERLKTLPALLATALVGGAALMLPAASYSSRPSVQVRPAGRAARSLDGTTTGRLHLVRAEGSQLFEEGPVSGALDGSMRATLSTGASFSGTFATHTGVGSIYGRGRATPHGSGRYQSFSGTFLVTGGSGRYTHISGHGGLYGVFDRRSDSVVIQTTGKLSF